MPVPDMIDANLSDDDVEVAQPDKRGVALWVRNHARPILVSGGAILGRKVGETEDSTLIDLTDYNGYKLGVSRRHAQIDCTDQGCLLLDLGSSNGTWINGLRLQQYQPAALRSGDRIYLARLELIVGPISSEALRRARHIPNGTPTPTPRPNSFIVPSDLKTDSLDPGKKKSTLPVERKAPAEQVNPAAQPPKAPGTDAQQSSQYLKATIVSPPHSNGDKPVPGADKHPQSAAGTPGTASPAANDAAKPGDKPDDKAANPPTAKNDPTPPQKPGDHS